jgi:hypothetical protein
MFQNDGSWSLSKKQTTTSLVAEVSVFVTLDDMYVSENTEDPSTNSCVFPRCKVMNALRVLHTNILFLRLSRLHFNSTLRKGQLVKAISKQLVASCSAESPQCY